MKKVYWKLLTVVFVCVGLLMVVVPYTAKIMGITKKTIYGDRADGYVEDGEVKSSSYTWMYVTYNYEGVKKAVSFIYFDTRNIPKDAQIEEVKLKIYVYSIRGELKLFLYPVLFLRDTDWEYPHKPYTAKDANKENYDSMVTAGYYKKGREGWHEYLLPQTAVNKGGWTKFAIFPAPSPKGFKITFMTADSTYKPQLIVTYSTPDYYTLTVRTTPARCKVSVGGQTKISDEYGKATFRLEEGTYKVTVSKEGYKTKTVTVSLYEDKTIYVKLEKITKEYKLTIYTDPPNCWVKVTNKETWTANSGNEGKCEFILPEDSYTVTVSKEGYESKTHSFYLDSDKEFTYRLTPTIKRYTLRVYVDPIGATVEVGGQTKTVPSTGYVDFDLEEGSYVVTVYKDGYSTVTKEIELKEDTEIHITLTPERPEVAITHYMSIIGAGFLLLAIPCGVKGWLI